MEVGFASHFLDTPEPFLLDYVNVSKRVRQSKKNSFPIQKTIHPNNYLDPVGLTSYSSEFCFCISLPFYFCFFVLFKKLFYGGVEPLKLGELNNIDIKKK